MTQSDTIHFYLDCPVLFPLFGNSQVKHWRLPGWWTAQTFKPTFVFGIINHREGGSQELFHRPVFLLNCPARLNNLSSSAVTSALFSIKVLPYPQPGLKMHLHINPHPLFLKVSRENETTQSVLVLLLVLLQFMADLIIFVTQKGCVKTDSSIKGR